MRRFWPESLVAWSRLLAGRFHDPLVGRDLLVGLIFGGATLSLGSLLLAGATLAGGPPHVSIHADLTASSVGLLAEWLGRVQPVDWLVACADLALVMVLVSRFGLLALVGTFVPLAMAFCFPAVGTDLSAWTAPALLAPPAVFLALALWSFRTALAGQHLLADDV